MNNDENNYDGDDYDNELDAEGMKAQNLTKFLNSHPRVTVDRIEPLVHLEKTWNSQNIMIIAMTNIRVIVVRPDNNSNVNM